MFIITRNRLYFAQQHVELNLLRGFWTEDISQAKQYPDSEQPQKRIDVEHVFFRDAKVIPALTGDNSSPVS